jgi:hypothetical protein
MEKMYVIYYVDGEGIITQCITIISGACGPSHRGIRIKG